MSEKEIRDDRYVHRRKFIQLAAAAGAAGLAGCSGSGSDTPTSSDGSSSDGGDGDGGDGDGSDGSSDGTPDTSDGASGTQSGGDVVDQTLTYKLFQPPDKSSNWNYYAFEGDISGNYFFDPLMWFNRETREWIPGIVESFSTDGTTTTLTINGDATWENGDAVTAADLVAQYRLDYYTNDQTWPGSWEGVEAVDEQTVEITTSKPVNRDVFAEQYMTAFLWVKESEYGEYLDQFENASSDEEVSQLSKKMTGQGDTEPMVIEDPVGNGPFSFDRIGSRAITANRNPEYGQAENINFSQIEGRYFGNPQTLWQSFISDSDVDAATNMSMPGDVVKTLPDHIIEHQYPLYAGLALIFQHRNELLRRVNVKKALAWVVNRKQAVTNGRPRLARTIEYPDDVKANRDYWLGDKGAQLSKYGYDSVDHDKAAALLEEEGFSQEGGTWHTPDGSEWSLNLVASTKSADSLMGQTVTQNLRSFGINANFRTVDPGTWWSPTYTGGEFEDLILAWSWAGFENPYWGYYYGIAASHEHMGHGYPNPPDDDSGGPPFAEGEWMVETPWPAYDPDGMEEVNVREKILSLQTIQDEEEYRSVVQELAWIYNQTLPKVPLEVMQGQNIINPREWDIVSQDDPGWSVGGDAAGPPFYLPRAGKWTAKE
mgnify:CR=1 FL=1